MAEQTAEGRYQQKPFLLKEKIADMHKYGKRAVDQFPRREKQTADEIRASMLRMFELSISVEKSYGSEKRKSLEALDRENAVLRHLIRLSSDNYLHINIDRGKEPTLYLAEIDTLLQKKLPAHIAFEVKVRYTYAVVTSVTHSHNIHDYRLKR